MSDSWWEIARLAVSGALGGAVRWMTLREQWRDGLISVLLGAICAVFLGPLVVPILTPAIAGLVVDEASRSTLSGFVIGVGGITVSGLLIDLWRIRRQALEANAKGDQK